MKKYATTLLIGLLGLICVITTYSKFSITIQILIEIFATMAITLIAICDRKSQLKDYLEGLVFEMKHFVTYVWVTNRTESERSLEVQQLYRYFSGVDRTTRVKSISMVYHITIEQVEEMLKEEIPDDELNSPVFWIAKW